MKRCAKCYQQKSLSEFSFKNKEKNILSSYCKICNRSYQKDHYNKNQIKYREKRKAWRAEFRKIIREKIKNYLNCHPCVDCGETDYTVLEFDHIKGDKLSNIATLICNDVSWQIIEKEITKCEVRCANCHKRRSAKQFGWYKYI